MASRSLLRANTARAAATTNRQWISATKSQNATLRKNTRSGCPACQLPAGGSENMMHFYKNLVMTGGLLYVIAFGPGAFALDKS
jgi:uncharacterized membrane protein YphA (DoxX/SURF4 family)